MGAWLGGMALSHGQALDTLPLVAAAMTLMAIAVTAFASRRSTRDRTSESHRPLSSLNDPSRTTAGFNPFIEHRVHTQARHENPHRPFRRFPHRAGRSHRCCRVACRRRDRRRSAAENADRRQDPLEAAGRATDSRGTSLRHLLEHGRRGPRGAGGRFHGPHLARRSAAGHRRAAGCIARLPSRRAGRPRRRRTDDRRRRPRRHHLHFTGHFTGTFNGVQGKGQVVDFIATDIYRIRDGKITDNWHLEDNLTFLQQLGVVARPGADPAGRPFLVRPHRVTMPGLRGASRGTTQHSFRVTRPWTISVTFVFSSKQQARAVFRRPAESSDCPRGGERPARQARGRTPHAAVRAFDPQAAPHG